LSKLKSWVQISNPFVAQFFSNDASSGHSIDLTKQSAECLSFFGFGAGNEAPLDLL
jgi:hypothetical protein